MVIALWKTYIIYNCADDSYYSGTYEGEPYFADLDEVHQYSNLIKAKGVFKDLKSKGYNVELMEINVKVLSSAISTSIDL